MGRQVKQRNIVVCIILLFVTCGLYGLYWLANMVDDLNALTGNENDTSGVMVIIFNIITCGIYGWYWFYKAGKKVNVLDGEQDNSILFLILALFQLSIVNYAIIQDKINRHANVI